MGKKLELSKRWLVTGMVCVLILGAESSGWGTVHVNAASDRTTVSSLQEIQQRFAEGLAARKLMIALKYKGTTLNLEHLLKKALNNALDGDPYTKYVVDRYVYSWRGTTGSAKITLRVDYRESAEQSAYVRSKAMTILKRIIKPDMSGHEKIKAIHDYIVTNLRYDTDYRNYTAYEGLRTGEAVCQGYTLLTYQLLKGAGLENLIVEGKAGGQLHAWNLVRIDGLWYHLDTTWDDPQPNYSGGIKYTYYLRSDTQMRKDHIWQESRYPKAAVPYLTTLQALVDQGGVKSVVFQSLKMQLGYQLYDVGSAVTDSKGLTESVKGALQEDKAMITLRYAGTERKLLRDLSSLYDLGIQNVRYTLEPLEGTRDLKVQIFWDSKKQ